MEDKSDPKKARCKYCAKSFDITTMGISAMKSQGNGDKHKQRLAAALQNLRLPFQHTFQAGDTSDPGIATTSSHPFILNTVRKQPEPINVATQSDVLRAECWWVLKTVCSGYSFHSNADIGFLFKQMFPNDNIANKFQCGETKTKYLACHGIAPHFRSELIKKIRGDSYVMMFDESLNKDMQKKQLDFLIRHLDYNEVRSRYFNSSFLGHAAAYDISDSCFDKIACLGFKDMLRISMDGPNVNWSFFDKFQKSLSDEYNTKLLDIGSCGIHKCHNAFAAGALKSGWHIDKYLKSLYTLLKDVPARRDDYEKSVISEVPMYPKIFCVHRWVENVPVANRAIEIHNDVVSFVNDVVEKKYGSRPIDTKSFEIVKDAVRDPLLTAKLSCFRSIASVLDSFLNVYQTDKPMIPFLAQDAENIVRKLLQRFMNHKLLEKAETVRDLLEFDFHDSKNKLAHKVDFGFTAERIIKGLRKDDKISELQEMEFHMQTSSFLETLVGKFLSKSPLKYALVRNLSALDPAVICAKPDLACTRFKGVVNTLFEAGRITSDLQCEKIIDHFQDFITLSKTDASFLTFDKGTGRLDPLYYDKLQGKSQWQDLWGLVRQILLLSHGQASVERGFSVNKHVTDVNIGEETLTSRRMIKDHVLSVGGIENIQITPELLQCAASARQCYFASLEQKKSKQPVSGKRKKATDELDAAKRRKIELESMIKSLEESCEKFAIEAETKRQICLITKSNKAREDAKVRREELQALQCEIDLKTQEIKNLWMGNWTKFHISSYWWLNAKLQHLYC